MSEFKTKKTIHFLAASDRINYGDLLFPILCKEVYKESNIDFKNYGIIKSDLSHFGGLPGKSYRDLKNAIKTDGGNILVGGGEVLFADWQVLLSYLSPTYARLIKIRNFRRLNKWFHLDEFLFNKTRNLFPFIIEKCWNSNVFYNAVGGEFKENLEIKDEDIIIESLKSAKILSVRDKRTLNKLKEKDIEASLTPDSAIILSDIFHKTELERTFLNINSLPPNKSYLFIQVGKNCAPTNKKRFVLDLEKIGQIMDSEVILCPIGLASGHEDHVVLKEFCEIGDNLSYYHPKSIYEIMTLIAFSKVYLGTSLHGLITAQSYGIPFIPLNSRLKKVEGYCQTWTSGNIEKPMDFAEIINASEIVAKWNYKAAKVNLKEQKALVYQNFKEIFENFD